MAPHGTTEVADVANTDSIAATFNVDESVAAAVFAHVTDTRDRLALACVSRVWRKVASSEGCWGTHDDLYIYDEKITDDRLERLNRYCADVKCLEIWVVPASFKGRCLFKETLAKKFASLETLMIQGCPGLRCQTITRFLQLIGMHDRPKDEPLRCLRLDECNVNPEDLEHFNVYLRVGASESYLQETFKDEANISFNLWKCSECSVIVETPDIIVCVVCKKTYCGGYDADVEVCADECGYIFCDQCIEFVCKGECEETVNKITCVLCERTFCEKCVRNFAQGSTDILKRYERYCEECRMPLRSPSRA